VRIFPALTATALTACSSGASYTERMNYLRKVANRGVETHNLLYSQGARIDPKRCGDAYDGLADDDIPDDIDDGGGTTPEWQSQVRQFFVDSCVTGLPKPVPGQATPTTPPPTSATPTSPAPSKTPTKTP